MLNAHHAAYQPRAAQVLAELATIDPDILDGLDEDQRQWVAVLFDPRHDPARSGDDDAAEIRATIEEHLDYLTEFSSYLSQDRSDVDFIADRIAIYYSSLVPEPRIVMDSDSEGLWDGYSVSLFSEEAAEQSVANDVLEGARWTGIRLTRGRDIKYVTDDREAQGLDAALSVATALAFEMERLIETSHKAGLLNRVPARAVTHAQALLAQIDTISARDDIPQHLVADLVSTLRRFTAPFPAASTIDQPLVG